MTHLCWPLSVFRPTGRPPRGRLARPATLILRLRGLARAPRLSVCELAAEEHETESFCETLCLGETLCLEECVEQSSCEECRGQSSSPFATAGKQKVGGF